MAIAATPVMAPPQGLASLMGPVIDYANQDPAGVFGTQQLAQVAPGALPAQWYTLFGISHQTAAANGLQPTADQLAMFSAMQNNPQYASIFQQSQSAQGANWTYTPANQALAQQAQTAWANGTLNPTPQQTVAANTAADPFNTPGAQNEFLLESRGYTAQQATDATLGIGQYQQGIVGAGGGSTGGGSYVDVSPGGYTAAPTLAAAGGNLSAFTSNFNEWETAMQSAESDYENAVGTGVQNYYASIGENSQGISQTQITANDATFNSIQTSPEQQAWLMAQDPGNLSPTLRAQWSALVLPQDQAIAAQNQSHEYVSGQMLEGMAPGQVPASVENVPDGGGFDVTIGSQVVQDATTGRVTDVNDVPTAVSYDAPQLGSTTNAMNRLGGAVGGGIEGFVGSGGNPFAAAMGAVSGSGALGGLSGKNLGTWKWGQSSNIGLTDSLAAIFTAGFSQYGVGTRVGVGTALGSVGAFANGGNLKQGVAGGAMGAFSGYMGGSNGNSAYQRVPSSLAPAPSFNYF